MACSRAAVGRRHRRPSAGAAPPRSLLFAPPAPATRPRLLLGSLGVRGLGIRGFCLAEGAVLHRLLLDLQQQCARRLDRVLQRRRRLGQLRSKTWWGRAERGGGQLGCMCVRGGWGRALRQLGSRPPGAVAARSSAPSPAALHARGPACAPHARRPPTCACSAWFTPRASASAAAASARRASLSAATCSTQQGAPAGVGAAACELASPAPGRGSVPLDATTHARMRCPAGGTQAAVAQQPRLAQLPARELHAQRRSRHPPAPQPSAGPAPGAAPARASCARRAAPARARRTRRGSRPRAPPPRRAQTPRARAPRAAPAARAVTGAGSGAGGERSRAAEAAPAGGQAGSLGGKNVPRAPGLPAPSRRGPRPPPPARPCTAGAPPAGVGTHLLAAHELQARAAQLVALRRQLRVHLAGPRRQPVLAPLAGPAVGHHQGGVGVGVPAVGASAGDVERLHALPALAQGLLTPSPAAAGVAHTAGREPSTHTRRPGHLTPRPSWWAELSRSGGGRWQGVERLHALLAPACHIHTTTPTGQAAGAAHQESSTCTRSSRWRSASTLLAPGCHACTERPSGPSTTYLYSATQPAAWWEPASRRAFKLGMGGQPSTTYFFSATHPGGIWGARLQHPCPLICNRHRQTLPCSSALAGGALLCHLASHPTVPRHLGSNSQQPAHATPALHTRRQLHRGLPLVALSPLQLRRLGHVPGACRGGSKGPSMQRVHSTVTRCSGAGWRRLATARVEASHCGDTARCGGTAGQHSSACTPGGPRRQARNK